MDVTGFVDGLVGAYLSGWALALPSEDHCEIAVLNDAGAVVGTALASRPRSDLTGLAHGRTNFAFRLPVAGLGTSTLLRVLANGVELGGSPIATGAGLFDGVVTISDGHAEGWVHERRLGFAPPPISLFDQDGMPVGHGLSVIGGGDPLFSPARFRIPLTQSAFGRPELHLRAEAAGVPFSNTQASLSIKGYLDALDDTHCAGWLLCPEAPGRRFEIDICHDGEVVGSGTCELPRADLRSIYPQVWQSGFDIAIEPPRARPTRPQQLSIRLHGSNVELFDGPFVVGARPCLIDTARRVARLVHTQPDLNLVERSVLQAAMRAFIDSRRHGAAELRLPQAPVPQAPVPQAGVPAASDRRFTVIIPIYRDAAVTKACIDSVLRHRVTRTDALILVNDASPDDDMVGMLNHYIGKPNLFILTNSANLGFVKTVNRALAFCRFGDVILLNSDTRVFAGGLGELWLVAHAHREIGTATAISNNATIFSYPTMDEPCHDLADATWPDLAAAALARNRGLAIDVPTGHGFCMLVRRELLDQAVRLDEGFGRGYGEENDLCLRAVDLGFRNVACPGAFVEHRESISFGDEKVFLLKANLPILEQRFPEYAADVQSFLKTDPLRAGRWALDRFRLQRLAASRRPLVLTIRNWLDGGTRKAAEALEQALTATGPDVSGEASRHGGATLLDLNVDIGGMIRLRCTDVPLEAVFAANEADPLIEMLSGLTIKLVLVHQLLGFKAAAIARLTKWIATQQAIFYVHDFYSLCPRVTMIDAVGQFCDVAPVDVCARCVDLGGAHDASRLDTLSPAEHRALLGGFVASVSHVVAPSASAAAYIARAFPGLAPQVLPHPEPEGAYPAAARDGKTTDIVLLGAIGPHKGSALLLELAQRAWLAWPNLRFHVIGYTDIDKALRAVGNVSVSGLYDPTELDDLVARTGAQLALFLHRWPETYSYTLSEAVQLGLVPLVPDIGAPAARVRASGFGHVFGFPIDPAEVLALLGSLAEGTIAMRPGPASPASFATPGQTHPAIAELLARSATLPPAAAHILALVVPNPAETPDIDLGKPKRRARR